MKSAISYILRTIILLENRVERERALEEFLKEFVHELVMSHSLDVYEGMYKRDDAELDYCINNLLRESVSREIVSKMKIVKRKTKGQFEKDVRTLTVCLLGVRE